MDSLRKMSLRHDKIKHIYTKQMKEGTSIREHVLDIMMHFNITEGKEVEANVATIEKECMGGSTFKIKVGPSQMKKKGKDKTPKNNGGIILKLWNKRGYRLKERKI
ncbi:gag/pol protein [Cucumis melo var. makuwa]|uniref:Gag/pol protein n=1 Tax=Cucumis melo var. makuwa TaxID=1194695 RepID=A0A5A7V1V7_CUCMM|nr:gag/pol protein [Cucumis melo var. makuwa]